MANKKVWLRAADVMIDEETGAILVKLGAGITIDSQALIDGIAGGKTLSDLSTAIVGLAKESDGNLAALKAAGDILIKDAGTASRAMHIDYAAPAQAISEGAASNGVALKIESTPYRRALLYAKKRAAAPADHKKPIDNTGTLFVAPANDCKDSIPLTPCSWMELPPNGDLSAWYVMAETANDGVMIVWEA